MHVNKGSSQGEQLWYTPPRHVYTAKLTCSIVSVDACTDATGWFMTAAAAAWAAALAALAAAAAAVDSTSPPSGKAGGIGDPASECECEVNV